MPAQNNVLNVILNFDDTEKIPQIRNILKELLEYLKNDLEFVTLSVGYGQQYPGIESDIVHICEYISTFKHTHTDFDDIYKFICVFH